VNARIEALVYVIASNGSIDECTTSDAKAGASNRVPVGHCLQAFCFLWLRELDLRGLATTIICSSGDLRRKAVR
jgi:hypothetical protein